MWHTRPPRDPPPFMAKTILNFHFDYLKPRLRILAQLLHLSESHLLRLCFGVFQPSVFCVFSRTRKQTVKCQYNRTQSWWRI